MMTVSFSLIGSPGMGPRWRPFEPSTWRVSTLQGSQDFWGPLRGRKILLKPTRTALPVATKFEVPSRRLVRRGGRDGNYRPVPAPVTGSAMPVARPLLGFGREARHMAENARAR